jgi:hypothetical protein
MEEQQKMVDMVSEKVGGFVGDWREVGGRVVC